MFYDDHYEIKDKIRYTFKITLDKLQQDGVCLNKNFDLYEMRRSYR